ncbi:CopG family transcriptional regulator [Candidatus Methylocalor cossyra]|uniref:CopG domain protein DNA-binding domain protein n=1 Tax=Candidatus Methylocalor cossyra TaxID=3108543 RepID=A0ABM9NKA3_9GAMM
MSILSIRLPDELDRQLQEEARRAEKTRSELVRDIVAEYLVKQEKARFMAELVAAAKAMANDPEAVAESLEIAEDFFPLDNEALDIAEGRKPGEPWPEETEGKWWK